jgi:hypothetical protein
VFVHGPEIRAEVKRLSVLGVTDREIAGRLGVPRSTVRDLRRRAPRTTVCSCPRCWQPTRPLDIASDRYAYLLGLYLGDGCIQPTGRTYSLRLSLDAKYPGVVAEAKQAMTTCSPTGRVSEHLAGSRRTTTVLCVYGNHLPCLFPQHGPGKKHERAIVLESWQEDCVADPWPLIRGLIQSDGCRFLNRTGKYEYPSYDFCLLSTDIQGIFTWACDRAGVCYRVQNDRVRINRRPDIALMDQHVGDKR